MMRGALSDDVELLWSAPGHAVARWYNIFVQVRWGEMTLDALAALERLALLTRTRLRTFARRGGLLVAGPDAPATTGQAKREQRRQLEHMLADERMSVALVIEGDGLHPDVQRASARMLVGAGRHRLFGTVDAAGDWLAAEVEIDAHALAAFVQSLRSRSGAT
jgi:hypothetical protein